MISDRLSRNGTSLTTKEKDGLPGKAKTIAALRRFEGLASADLKFNRDKANERSVVGSPERITRGPFPNRDASLGSGTWRYSMLATPVAAREAWHWIFAVLPADET